LPKTFSVKLEKSTKVVYNIDEEYTMRIGIFGGSFDPIHGEHVSLARQAVDDLSLHRLFVLPAANPPHKPWRKLALDEKRLAMCRLAFEGEEKITVSDYELKKGGVSYTYQTLEYFRAAYPNAELYFLMGTDMLRYFPFWKEPQRIVELCTIAVCARAEEGDWVSEEREKFRNCYGKDFAVLSYCGKDVSSTKIRVLSGAGLDVTEFVGEKVAWYMEENGLYAIEGARESLALQKPSRAAHSIRVAMLAAKRAGELHIDERKAIQASLLHDCAKNLSHEHPLLDGFELPEGCPPAVAHQYAGEYVARVRLGVSDPEVLSAIACHTSGKIGMSELDKLIFLADLVEEARVFAGVERLRELFWESMDECLLAALSDTVEYLTRSGQPIYEKTLQAKEYYEKEKKDGRNDQQ
jgi:nicotinate-nucleotide adenylyltransferase